MKGLKEAAPSAGELGAGTRVQAGEGFLSLVGQPLSLSPQLASCSSCLRLCCGGTSRPPATCLLPPFCAWLTSVSPAAPPRPPTRQEADREEGLPTLQPAGTASSRVGRGVPRLRGACGEGKSQGELSLGSAKSLSGWGLGGMGKLNITATEALTPWSLPSQGS